MNVSRIEMVLLGIIEIKPSYAYEIDQFIKDTHMRRWVRIGSASVYQGLERLASKGFAKSKREREGKMPTRHRYTITAKGKEALRAAAETLLSQCEDHYLDLNLGFFCSHVIAPPDILNLLKKRLAKLDAKHREIKEHALKVKKGKVWRQGAILTTLMEFCWAEHTVLKNIIRTTKAKQG